MNDKKQIELLVSSDTRRQFDELVSRSGGNITAYFSKLIEEKWIEMSCDDFDKKQNAKGYGCNYKVDFNYEDNLILINKSKEYLVENGYEVYDYKTNVETYILYSIIELLHDDEESSDDDE